MIKKLPTILLAATCGALVILVVLQGLALDKQDAYLESLQEEIETCQSENPNAPKCVIRAIPVDPV